MSRFLRIDVRWSAVLTGVVVLAALLIAISGPGAQASPSGDGPVVSSGPASSHVELAAAQTDRASRPSAQPFDVSIDPSTAQLVSGASIEDLGPVGGGEPA